MYKINDVAKIFGISPQTIRYYEKEGLIMPAKKDEQSGYRYYSNESIDQLGQILQLRNLGMNISQLKKYFNHHFSKEEKIVELKGIIEICNRQIMCLEAAILYEKHHTEFDINVKQVHSRWLIQEKAIIEDHAEGLKIYTKLLAYASKKNIRLCEPYVFLTQSKEMEGTTLFDVLGGLVCKEEVEGETIEMPSYKAVCTYYYGKMNETRDIYQQLFEYIEKNKLQISGVPVECYLGYYNPISDIGFIEIQIPIN